MDTKKLLSFLIIAREHTYAGNSGEMTPIIDGHKQYEYRDGDWMYRDMYIVGSERFVGYETIYYKAKPVWSMSYFGNFSGMSENGADTILRKAMLANGKTTRLWQSVDWQEGNFHYQCDGAGSGIEEIKGNEKIVYKDHVLYYFFYTGGIVA